jgi:hypothetical protein
MPSLKPEDLQHFGDLLQEKELDELSAEEARDRRIKMLLLKARGGLSCVWACYCFAGGFVCVFSACRFCY